MESTRFDALARRLSQSHSRRGLLGGVLAGVLLARAGAPALARPRKKHPKKPCPTGQKRCGGKCVDLQTDKTHCGSCANACGASGDLECCGGACANLASDAANCGACGTICDEDLECVQRSCVKRCHDPEIRCLITCVNVQTDIRNCGQCSHNCAPNELCRGGACVCPGPICPTPDGGSRCCPASGGICCDTGLCCPSDATCTASGCCPANTFDCGNGTCCPFGTTCGGDCGADCCAT